MAFPGRRDAPERPKKAVEMCFCRVPLGSMVVDAVQPFGIALGTCVQTLRFKRIPLECESCQALRTLKGYRDNVGKLKKHTVL
jgi:hypothetical protein